VLNGKTLALGLTLAQASLGLFACCGGTVSFVFDPRQLLAPVAILLGSLRCFVLPLMSALSDCGQLAHHALSGQDGRRMDRRSFGTIKMTSEDRALLCGVHLETERGERSSCPHHETRRRDDV